MTDLKVRLKSADGSIIRPETLAELVKTTTSLQFVSGAEKTAWTKKLNLNIVEQLPEAGESNIVYVYQSKLYIWNAGNFELVGGREVDLTPYALTEDIAKAYATKEELKADVTFEKDTPTTIAVGGIAKGTSLKDKKLEDIINSLFFPYVAPQVSSFSLRPSNGGVFEVGTTVSLTGATIGVTLGSENLTKVRVLDGAQELASKTEGLGSSNALEFALDIKTTKTLKAEATDGRQTPTRNSSTFTFVSPYYFGSVDAGATLDETTIKALTKKVEIKGSKTLAFTHANKFSVLAYPASYGNIKKVMDQNNFDVTASFVKQANVEITGLDGVKVAYIVYKAAEANTLDGFKFTFSY